MLSLLTDSNVYVKLFHFQFEYPGTREYLQKNARKEYFKIE